MQLGAQKSQTFIKNLAHKNRIHNRGRYCKVEFSVKLAEMIMGHDPSLFAQFLYWHTQGRAFKGSKWKSLGLGCLIPFEYPILCLHYKVLCWICLSLGCRCHAFAYNYIKTPSEHPKNSTTSFKYLKCSVLPKNEETKGLGMSSVYFLERKILCLLFICFLLAMSHSSLSSSPFTDAKAKMIYSQLL